MKIVELKINFNFISVFCLQIQILRCIFALLQRAISSAGSEHLVYTEGVGGSNPSSPTKLLKKLGSFFLIYIFPRSHKKHKKKLLKYFYLRSFL